MAELKKSHEILIGVGPVQLLPSAPNMPLRSQIQLKLILAPRTGLLSANGIVIRSGASISIDDVVSLNMSHRLELKIRQLQ